MFERVPSVPALKEHCDTPPPLQKVDGVQVSPTCSDSLLFLTTFKYSIDCHHFTFKIKYTKLDPHNSKKLKFIKNNDKNYNKIKNNDYISAQQKVFSASHIKSKGPNLNKR